MSRPALSATAAELAAAISDKSIVVATSCSEHHRDGAAEAFYSLDVYTRNPWEAVVQFSANAPIGNEDEPVLRLVDKARQWLAVGESLRYLGAPICTRCDDDGRFRLATDLEHELCAECCGREAERQSQASDAEYYGGSTPTFAETVRGAS